MDFSNYMEEQILGAIFRGTTFPVIGTQFISLHTADPGETGTSEVTAGDYARIAVVSTTAQWTDPATAPQGEVENINDIVFAAATSTWGTITHIGLFSAITAGNFHFKGTLAVPILIDSGKTFKINSTDLTVEVN